MQTAADGLEVVADRELGDETVARRLREAHAEELGQAARVLGRQLRWVDRHGVVLLDGRVTAVLLTVL